MKAETLLARNDLAKRRVHLVDHSNYEDRVRALLLDMEEMSRDHWLHLAQLREKLNESNALQDTLREQVARFKNDAFEALRSERAAR